MSIATSTAIGIAGVAGLAGAGIAAGASSSAAGKQANAAERAAELQHEDAQAALQFQEQQYRNSLGLMEPYYATGTQSLGTLASLMGLTPSAPNMGIFGGQPGPTAGRFPGGFDFNGGGDFVQAPGGGGFKATSADAIQAPGGAGAAGTPEAMRMRGIDEGFQNPDIGTFRGGTTSPVTRMNGSPAVAAVPGGGGSTLPNGLPAGFLMQPWTGTFEAPTAITEQNDPGYQARLNLGEEALQKSAAARGSLLSGGTAADLTRYAQDYASNEYENIYNRAFNNYTTSYNVFKQNQQDIYNRYASLADLGQTTAGQLSNAGLMTGNSVANTLLTSGSQIGQQINNAAAARASGYVGGANALSGGLSGLSNLALMYQLLNRTGGGSGSNFPTPDYGTITFGS